MARRVPLTLLAALLLAAVAAPMAHAATALYPDLKTLAPRDLRLDRTDVSVDGSGQIDNVLRFSNTAWNNGAGKLELRGQIDPNTKTGPAIQRVYDDAGGYTDYTVGTFYWHAVHQHYHFDGWGSYQLWTKSDYDKWIASGRSQGQAKKVGTKTTSCVLDEEFVKTLARTPGSSVFQSAGCLPDSNNLMVQGLSPGWGDTYDYFRFEQWIDLGQDTLADGQYVLRSVTDPDNKIYESAGKSDSSVEGQQDNEATTVFTMSGGQIVDSDAPTGSVRINDVDSTTSSPNVTVKVLGRDDVSGVDQVRLSNDGSHWATYSYTGSQSTEQSISWDLTNSTYGGTSGDGGKTVYAQFHDKAGHWGVSTSDTISLQRTTGSSPYSSAVLADAPVGYWRLGESSGTTATDIAGSNNGTYTNGPQLGSPSLLAGEPGNTAVHFDGTNDYVGVPSSGALSPTSRVSVEAWIKPDALPASGSFATIASKRDAYALQFNGPRLEFTIMQNGVRKRTQAAKGAIQTGQIYHLVGTYDGSTARLYVNGAQSTSTSLTGAIGSNANSLDIGSWDGGGEFLKGSIDEVAVYPTALAATRVKAHYDAAASTTTTTVAAPTNLKATSVSSSRIDLQWTDNSSNESQFVIERSTSSSFSSVQTATVGPNVTSYSDTGLAASTTYYYRVKATTSGASSGYSNTASATTGAVTTTGYASTVLGDSPVSYWRLGEGSGTGAIDEKGVNPGTYLNSPTLGAPSLLGTDTANKAVDFDGFNDQVRVGDSNSLDLSSPITLEAWIKPAALPPTGQFASVLTKPESYSLQFNGPQIEFTIIQFGVRQRLQAPAGAVQTGQIYHVVGTFDGTTRRLYLNGTQVASATLSGGATTTSNSLFMGSWDGQGEFLRGTIDEVAVYNSALSSTTVLNHYNAGH